MLQYTDHHIFHSNDLKDIKQQFEKIESTARMVLTTEKDAVRLEKFENELKDFPIYVIPVQHEFLFNEEEAFENRIKFFINSFH